MTSNREQRSSDSQSVLFIFDLSKAFCNKIRSIRVRISITILQKFTMSSTSSDSETSFDLDDSENFSLSLDTK